jgi:hypothetical protein
MRGFGDYLVRQGLWGTNPLRWMKGPKVTPYRRLPKRIDREHMEAMWRVAAAPTALISGSRSSRCYTAQGCVADSWNDLIWMPWIGTKGFCASTAGFLAHRVFLLSLLEAKMSRPPLPRYSSGAPCVGRQHDSALSQLTSGLRRHAVACAESPVECLQVIESPSEGN